MIITDVRELSRYFTVNRLSQLTFNMYHTLATNKNIQTIIENIFVYSDLFKINLYGWYEGKVLHDLKPNKLPLPQNKIIITPLQ